jgi:hypothetical protein
VENFILENYTWVMTRKKKRKKKEKEEEEEKRKKKKIASKATTIQSLTHSIKHHYWVALNLDVLLDLVPTNLQPPCTIRYACIRVVTPCCSIHTLGYLYNILKLLRFITQTDLQSVD